MLGMSYQRAHGHGRGMSLEILIGWGGYSPYEGLMRILFPGFAGAQGKPSVLFTIFQYAEKLTCPTISFEALQVIS
ncbi:hypothetical protein CK203_013731 [Vitis vinifera]|uniref:Uncharacterized protein n=1 Tax=Vitis vinifera TaxID=29760 RepID=A0A438JJN2_VITVI|nr:hypothetical protein CK203_024137 [Vitis vinifera]RVX09171.1 hypothetical protein CK203_013731 [Vitis vinifera]